MSPSPVSGSGGDKGTEKGLGKGPATRAGPTMCLLRAPSAVMVSSGICLTTSQAAAPKSHRTGGHRFSLSTIPCLGFPLALPLFTVCLQHYKRGAGRQALFVDPSEGPGVNVEHLSQVAHP